MARSTGTGKDPQRGNGRRLSQPGRALLAANVARPLRKARGCRLPRRRDPDAAGDFAGVAAIPHRGFRVAICEPHASGCTSSASPVAVAKLHPLARASFVIWKIAVDPAPEAEEAVTELLSSAFGRPVTSY